MLVITSAKIGFNIRTIMSYIHNFLKILMSIHMEILSFQHHPFHIIIQISFPNNFNASTNKQFQPNVSLTRPDKWKLVLVKVKEHWFATCLYLELGVGISSNRKFVCSMIMSVSECRKLTVTSVFQFYGLLAFGTSLDPIILKNFQPLILRQGCRVDGHEVASLEPRWSGLSGTFSLRIQACTWHWLCFWMIFCGSKLGEEHPSWLFWSSWWLLMPPIMISC